MDSTDIIVALVTVYGCSAAFCLRYFLGRFDKLEDRVRKQSLALAKLSVK